MYKQQILVTGGAGYIGSVLVPMLLKEGFCITVLDNFTHKQETLLDCCGHIKEFEPVHGDARNEKLVADLMGGKDIIIPLAGLVGAKACKEDPVTATTVNLDAIKLILSIRSPGQKIIFPNTNSGYGIGQENIFCDESTPLNPLTLYGRLKVEAERAILGSGNSITLRLATVFGSSPRMRWDLLVNDFVRQALTTRSIVLFEGHFKRNYVHIKDVARAFIHCVVNFEKMKNEAYNVGLSNANLSKKELCEEIKKQIPYLYIHEAEVGEDPDKRNYIVSNKKIERTGFKATVTLQEGIAELIKAHEILKIQQHRNA